MTQPRTVARWPPRVAAAYTCLAALIPISLLYGKLGDDGLYVSRLYGHLFLYPLIFGWILVIALLRAQEQIAIILSRREVRRLTYFWLFLVVLAALIEFTRQPLAIAELSNAQLNQDLCATPLGVKCPYTSLQQVRDPIMVLRNDKLIPDDRYQTALSQLARRTSVAQWLSRDRNWHQASYALSYLLTVAIFTGAAITLVTAFVLYVRRRSLYLKIRRKVLRSLFLLYAAGVPWFFWYWAFQTYRTEYFGDRSSGGVAALLALIFFTCGIYLSFMLLRGRTSLLDRITGAAGVIAALGFGSVVFNPQWVELAFPKAPDIQHLAVMLGVLAVAAVPYLIVGEPEDRDFSPS